MDEFGCDHHMQLEQDEAVGEFLRLEDMKVLRIFSTTAAV